MDAPSSPQPDVPLRPFEIKPQGRGLAGMAKRLGGQVLERLLQFPALNDLHEASLKYAQETPYPERFLGVLGVKAIYKDEFLAQIPQEGPLVVVANHPFGGVEGIALLHVLQQVRPDVKAITNEMLTIIPGFKDLLLPVDVFGGPDAPGKNAKTMREAIRWVEDGHCLGVFPAGEVSALTIRRRTVADAQWNPQIARIVQRTGATVVPIFFEGHNSALFQLAGLIHPRLRSVLIPHEMMRRRDRPLRLRIGRPITPERMKPFATPEALTDYLRVRTYLLKKERKGEIVPPDASAQAPIIPPVEVDKLLADIAHLPPSAKLLSSGEFDVLVVSGQDAPNIMREVGRLREVCFRAAGEGSGKELDVDAYDERYLQLLLWNREKKELAGGYRMCRVDDVVAAAGVAGLYTHAFFRLDPRLIAEIGPSLELGRAWVRLEYQKSFAPLMLLWKGIGHYAAQNPKYRRLFGSVSISAEYSRASLMLLTAFLKANVYLPDLARLARPRNPLKQPGSRPYSRREFSTVVSSVEEVNTLVKELETDGKPMPVLLRQYLKLNGQLLGFNVDPDFGNVVDGLMLIDLCKVDRRTLERYMGDGMEAFFEHHAAAGTQ